MFQHTRQFNCYLKVVKKVIFLFMPILLFYSCKKIDIQNKQPKANIVKNNDDIKKILESDFFVHDRKVPDMAQDRNSNTFIDAQSVNGGGASDPEYTDEVPMILGVQLQNPYSISNMVQAYNTYYAANITTVPTTHLYVRFSPANETHLVTLEDSLEVEIFDYPLDYEVVEDGDFYQQPGKGAEDMPEFFAVVPQNFSFPSGIPYVILEELHFPHDDPILEALAESIAAGGHYSSYRINNTEPDIMMTRTDNNVSLRNENNCDCFPNPQHLECIPPDPDCYIPPPPTPPGGWQPPTPGPAPANTPSGYIRYQDNTANIDRPLRGVEVIAKRGRKTAKAYTDNNGFFVMGRNFPGSVKIIIKYRTIGTVNIKPLRLQSKIRLSLLTSRQRMPGRVAVGAMNQLNIRISENSNINTRGHMYWLAAHAVDAREQQNIVASITQDVKNFSGHRLVVYLQRRGPQLGRQPRYELLMENYLFKNRSLFDWGVEFGKVIMYAATGKPANILLTVFQNVLASQRPDIMFNYNTEWAKQRSNVVNQQFFSVYTECGLLKATNSDIKWKSYFKARVKEVDLLIAVASYGPLSALNKYLKETKLPDASNPTDPNLSLLPTYIAIVNTLTQYVYHTLSAPERTFFEQTRGFAEYYSHTMCNTIYTGTNNYVKDQFGETINSNASATSHKIFIDTWIPNLSIDYGKNNRIGLFEDLNNPVGGLIPRTTTQDLVANTKNKDMFNSIAAPQSMPPYTPTESWIDFREKVRFYNIPFSNQIVSLFTAYQIQ